MKRLEIERMKLRYPSGTRVELSHMVGEPQMQAGTKGTVQGVDDIGQIMVEWDNGSTLSLIPGADRYRVLRVIRENKQEEGKK